MITDQTHGNTVGIVQMLYSVIDLLSAYDPCIRYIFVISVRVKGTSSILNTLCIGPMMNDLTKSLVFCDVCCIFNKGCLFCYCLLYL